MSATLVIALPLALLGIVALVGFAGCAFQTGGISSAYFNAITQTAGLISLWGLDEKSDPREGPSPTAVDSATANHHFDGSYTQGPNVPMYDSVNQSAAASGNFTQGQPTIVPGDGATCTSFDGGFVLVPFRALLNPKSFTLEAWVQPQWTQTDVANSPAFRVVAATSNALKHTGFALFATPANVWEASVGNGSTFTMATGTTPVDLTKPTYLAATYDAGSGLLQLFVNASLDGKNTEPNYQPAQGDSLLIGIGTSVADPSSPMFPFTGSIADVAMYSGALDSNTLVQHDLVGKVG